MIEVMVIEDEQHIRRLLGKMIEKVDGFAVVSEASTVSEAEESFHRHPVDVAFVDIDLNGESGLDCARALCDISPQVKIIFATAHSEYMADAFEIYAFDYLVKPFNLERITRTLHRIQELAASSGSEKEKQGSECEIHGKKNESHQNTTGTQEVEEEEILQEPVSKERQYKDKLAIKGKEEILFVNVQSILFIERINGSTRIVTTEGTYNTSMSLSDVYEKLNPNTFMRSHRSYIINTSRIEKLTQYGRWTYSIAFQNAKETALMTHENYEKLKEMF
ncbi:MAG: LytTR family DNA-binding domain-containing protein [Lachnospira sp.]|nr:LytTR family DNA-binding domain-containing protein [Lachnospira sp.]